MKLQPQDEAKIVDRVAHQGDGEAWAMQVYGIELEQIEELMEDANYERCPECGNWVEAGELSGDDSEDRPCYNCQPRREE